MKPIPWRRSKWSRAIPTQVGEIRFPSRMEARVYSYLIAHLRPEERLIRQASFPLLGLAPDAFGKVQRFTPDFVIVSCGRPTTELEWTWMGAESTRWTGNGQYMMPCRGMWIRIIEAKGAIKSRDYALRKAAFEAVYGRVWEWDGNGEPPWQETQ